jgi:hypothetical protein
MASQVPLMLHRRIFPKLSVITDYGISQNFSLCSLSVILFLAVVFARKNNLMASQKAQDKGK